MTGDRTIRDPRVPGHFALGTTIDGYCVVDDRDGRPVTTSLAFSRAVIERDELNDTGTRAFLAQADAVLA